MRLRLLLDTDNRAGYTCVGLLRIQEVRADRKTILDETYVPSSLTLAASAALAGYVTELEGLLRHRGEALAGRVTGGGQGVSEVADFLMLQAVNRYQPIVRHLASTAEAHPETVFETFVGIAGELATFTAKGRRPPDFPAYKHHDIQASFGPVMTALRQALSAVLERSAVPVPLQERKYGVRVGAIPDRSLLKDAGFVLAIRADMPQDALRQNFQRLVKIGPVEQIRELVNVALPGIRVRPMPVAPRQIPFHSGAVYFELERGSPIWKQLEQSGGIAIHLAGDFPQLQMELWAIRG